MAPEKWIVNARCLEGIDPEGIPKMYTHGSELSTVHGD
jgi:hypothetical protein